MMQLIPPAEHPIWPTLALICTVALFYHVPDHQGLDMMDSLVPATVGFAVRSFQGRNQKPE